MSMEKNSIAENVITNEKFRKFSKRHLKIYLMINLKMQKTISPKSHGLRAHGQHTNLKKEKTREE